jgi:pyruvate dehydrogenase E2 component (dihydrolipoamide acetyltransferase)
MSETTLVDVILPDVGEGLVEAQIVEWVVTPGQAVTEDQTIVLISTDKATVELPAPTSGILREQVVPAGATVTVGTLLARIEAPRRAAEKLAPSSAEPAAKAPAQAVFQDSGQTAQAPVVGAAPSTRRLAQQLNVDLARVSGSGPNGRILDEDVRRAAAGNAAGGMAPPQSQDGRRPGQGDEERVALNRTRLATARSTAAAWHEIPHIVEFRQIDATRLQQARDAHRAAAEREGVHLTFLPFFVKAASVALTKHPSFNARLDLDREEVIYRRHCNIGIATASEAGLIVPVLHNVESKSVLDIARALDSLIDRARKQVLSLSDLSDGTFTITNFGTYGTWLGTPIIRAPDVAIVGFGRIQQSVLAVDGAAVVRPVLPISVATDHRVNDGVHLAGFLDALTEALCDPSLFSADDNGGGMNG